MKTLLTILVLLASTFCYAYGEHIMSDGSGGYYMPNGEHIMSDGSGGLYLPNGEHMMSDGSGGFYLP